MRRIPHMRRRREARRPRPRWFEIPEDTEVTGNAQRARAVMATYDHLPPATRAAIAATRFDADPFDHRRQAQIFALCEQPADAVDAELARRVRLEDDNYSGSFGPAFAAGI